MPDLTPYTTIAANTIRAKTDADTTAKLNNWYTTELGTYELEAIRELNKNAR